MSKTNSYFDLSKWIEDIFLLETVDLNFLGQLESKDLGKARVVKRKPARNFDRGPSYNHQFSFEGDYGSEFSENVAAIVERIVRDRTVGNFINLLFLMDSLDFSISNFRGKRRLAKIVSRERIFSLLEHLTQFLNKEEVIYEPAHGIAPQSFSDWKRVIEIGSHSALFDTATSLFYSLLTEISDSNDHPIVIRVLKNINPMIKGRLITKLLLSSRFRYDLGKSEDTDSLMFDFALLFSKVYGSHPSLTSDKFRNSYVVLKGKWKDLGFEVFKEAFTYSNIVHKYSSPLRQRILNETSLVFFELCESVEFRSSVIGWAESFSLAMAITRARSFLPNERSSDFDDAYQKILLECSTHIMNQFKSKRHILLANYASSYFPSSSTDSDSREFYSHLFLTISTCADDSFDNFLSKVDSVLYLCKSLFYGAYESQHLAGRYCDFFALILLSHIHYQRSSLDENTHHTFRTQKVVNLISISVLTSYARYLVGTAMRIERFQSNIYDSRAAVIKLALTSSENGVHPVDQLFANISSEVPISWPWEKKMPVNS